MRELAVLTFTTVDGVMQAPRLADEDRSGGLEGGWASSHWEQVMPQVEQHAMAEPYDVLLGRKTYELFFPNFSRLGDEHPMNMARKYVVSSSLSAPAWANSVVIRGDAAAHIAQLKRENGPLLQVHGSWQLVQALIAHDLVDEFRLWTFPSVVGQGKRLFGDGVPRRALELVKSAEGPSGVVMRFYRRA
ncbi:MAG: dihydrofolate reductase family protein [Myxococcota bacterium]